MRACSRGSGPVAVSARPPGAMSATGASSHLVHSLSRGGAGRALVSLARPGDTVAVLADVDPLLASQARGGRSRSVVAGRRSPSAASQSADLAVVHFWNTPELHELLRSGLPPVRLALWAHIAGDTPPHVITPELVELADTVVATSAHTVHLPVLPGRDAARDPGRARSGTAQPRPRRGPRRASTWATSARSISRSSIRASSSCAPRSGSRTFASSSAAAAEPPPCSRRAGSSSCGASSRRSARSSPSSTCSAIPWHPGTIRPRTSRCRRRCRRGSRPSCFPTVRLTASSSTA